MQDNTYLKGKIIYALGIFLYTINDALMKWLVPTYPVEKIIFYRSLIGVVIVLAFQTMFGKTAILKINNSSVMLARCIFSFGALFFSLKSLTGLDLSSFNMYYHLSPIFIVLFSFLFLKEPLTKNLLIALCAGFVGVILTFHPGIGTLSIHKGYVLLATLSWSFSMIFLKLLSNKDSSKSILFYNAVFNIIICALFVEEFTLAPSDLLAFSMLSAVHLLAFYIIIEGLKRAPLTQAAPLEYTGVIWALPISYFFWNEIPDMWMLVGGSLIIFASMYTLNVKNTPAKI